MKEEIIDKIAQYIHDATVYEHPDNKVIAEDIYNVILPIIEDEAQKFAGWISNQVIVGRTYHKLWIDYRNETT